MFMESTETVETRRLRLATLYKFFNQVTTTISSYDLESYNKYRK